MKPSDKKIFESLSGQSRCIICGTEQNLLPRNINHFHRLCESHKEYWNWFQVDKARVQLGYLKALPNADCALCDKPLSQEELESVGKWEANKMCNEHRWMAGVGYIVALEQFREQYKTGRPFVLHGRCYSKEYPQGIVVGQEMTYITPEPAAHA